MKKSKPTARTAELDLQHVVECILCGALAALETGLPSQQPLHVRRNIIPEMHDLTYMTLYEKGALESAGESLASLCIHFGNAHVTCYDALEMADNFHLAAEAIFAEAWKSSGAKVYAKLKKMVSKPCSHKQLYPYLPDCRKHARAFVKALFVDKKPENRHEES